jgi:hypothetical protein
VRNAYSGNWVLTIGKAVVILWVMSALVSVASAQASKSSIDRGPAACTPQEECCSAVKVPRLYGRGHLLDETKARSILGKANLEVRVLPRPSQVSAGKVYFTSPPAEAWVCKRERVTVYLSTGPERDCQQPPGRASADFCWVQLSGGQPLEFVFNDRSTGQVTSRTWDFGDDTSSNEADPTKVYTNPGRYEVTLNVTGPGGQADRRTRTAFVAAPGQDPQTDDRDWSNVSSPDAPSVVVIATGAGLAGLAGGWLVSRRLSPAGPVSPAVPSIVPGVRKRVRLRVKRDV